MHTKIVVLGLASLLSFTSLPYGDTSRTASAAASVNQAPIISLADFNKAVSEDRAVSRKAVTFKNGQIDMAGVLFAPANMEQGKTYPAIVVVHPGGGAKEQTASLY